MYIKQMVTECDFTDRKYDKPVEGAGVVAQGATGRWCVVMWAGPEFVQENNLTVLEPAEAEARIENELSGWAHF